jgi:hypothetical protein
MKHLFFSLFAVLLLVACKNSSGNQQIDALQKETMDIHDAAMKDMADMNRVARTLRNHMASASMTPEQSAEYTKGLSAIGDAENEMMAWMRDYTEPKGKSPEEALKYLEDQKAKIAKNHENIKAALEAGKKLLPQ